MSDQLEMSGSLVGAWFPGSNRIAKSRPGVHKIEGSVVPGRPGDQVVRLWFYLGDRMYQTTAEVARGENYLEALANALEAKYNEIVGVS